MRLRPALVPASLFLTIALGTITIGALDASNEASDVQYFAHAAGTLFSVHALRTYSAPDLQAGPLELALVHLTKAAGRSQTGFAILLDLACTLATAAAAWTILGRRSGPLALFAIGAFALWLPGAAYNGHPAELVIAALWALAAREARRGRTVLAGVLVGVAGCWEVWGVLGVAVLALAPRLRKTVPGIALAGAVLLFAFLPFALGGDFRMLDFHWVVASGVPRLVLGAGTAFTWKLRLLEGVVVVSAGALVARRLRRRPEAVWAVPAAIALVRIALDPVSYAYYWDTPLVLVLIGAAAIVTDVVSRAMIRGTSPSTLSRAQ